MPKDQKPAEELSGIAKQSIEQTRGAVDIGSVVGLVGI